MPFRNNSRSLKRVHHGECEPHIYEEMGDVGQGKLWLCVDSYIFGSYININISTEAEEIKNGVQMTK